MPAVLSYAAAACAAASAWVIRGALAVQSAAPNAPKVGLVPPIWELALFLLAGICIVFLMRPSPQRMMPLFATAICLLPWVPGIRSAAVLMWTGPLAVALWCAAVAATALHGHRREASLADFTDSVFADARLGAWLAGLFAFLFLGIVAFGARGSVPSGDEPHYLIITQSLLYDGDIQIENNHLRRDYESYFGGTLQPDFWRRGENGAIYSVHAPGLPALVAPAFLVGGYRGVVVFLLLVSAVAAGLLWRLSFVVSGRRSAAWFAVVATISATPVAFHGFTVFPDGPAGFLMLTAVWALLRLARLSPLIPVGGARTWVFHGLALALLPWMHARLAALAGAAGLLIVLRMSRHRDGFARGAAFLAAPIVSAIAWFTFFFVVYGTPSPAAPWTRLVTSWSFIPGGLAGILFDQQFGALLYAPVLLVAAVGWFVLFKTHRRLAVELAVIAVPYVIVTTRLWIWWAGWSAPARFWTPLFWMGGIAAAMGWSAATTRVARWSALAALFVSAATTLGLAFAYGGRLAYNVRDGYSRWFDWLSGIADLPLGLPSFFQAIERQRVFDLQVLIVVSIFALTFFALRWADRRVGESGTFALLVVGGYAVAVALVVGVLLAVNQATGIRATNAQLWLLDAARNVHRSGVLYNGQFPRLAGTDETMRTLSIASPPRLAAEPGAPPLVLPGWFPAGTYRVSAKRSGEAVAQWEIRVLRAGPPILSGTLSPGNRDLDLSVTLPLDTPAFILRGGTLGSASLTPEHVATRRDRFEADRAQSATRYGRTIAWFVDEHAYGDPDGIWIKGGGVEARLLLQPDSGTWVQVLVRNGPRPNQLTLSTEAGDWSWSAPLNPGEEREVRVPVDAARRAVLLRAVSASGFRPSDQDPGNRDTRWLGVWMRPE